MNQSNNVLITVKKSLGIMPADTAFDEDISMHINTVISNMISLGILPKDCTFQIETGDEEWQEIPNFSILTNNMKSYISMKVRTMFDPPTNNVHNEAINNNIKEIEFRLYALLADNDKKSGSDV